MKKTIQELMNKHSNITQEIRAKIKAWEADPVYSNEHKKEQIKKLRDEAIQHDAHFNEQLKGYVSQWKTIIFGEPISKPADYELKISNALKFLELAGSNLTDNQTFDLLKPFKGDFETMKLFQNAVAKLTEGSGVLKSFEKTFGETNRMITMNNSLEFAEQTAGSLFDSSSDGLNQAIKMSMFMESIDSINSKSEGVNE